MNIIKYALLITLVFIQPSILYGEQIEVIRLSMIPPSPCKVSSKKGPPKKVYPGFSTPGNFPFINDRDINGDGICDWIGIGAMPPHRDQYLWDEPELKDFIFLGTMNGLRNFGNPKKLKEYIFTVRKGNEFPLFPDTEVSAFIDPTFVYEIGNPIPFVVTIEIDTDLLESEEKNISVFRWNKTLDSLVHVKKNVRNEILIYLRNNLCKSDTTYLGSPTVEDATCRVKK